MRCGELVRGDRVLQMTFMVITDAATDAELESRAHTIQAIFRDRIGSEAVIDDSIGMGVWLSSLLFNYHPIADYTAQRSVRLLKSDLVHFLPVFDSYRGLPEKQSLFFSRENNLAWFALKGSGNSHHTAVIGDTGSAKSGLVISLLLAEMRRDPKPVVFVIDRKTSYGMVSRVLNSELTTFERSRHPVFALQWRMRRRKDGVLGSSPATAIKLTSVQFDLDSEHKTCLTEGIRRAYSTKSQRAGRALRERGPRGAEFGDICKSGYARRCDRTTRRSYGNARV